MLRIFHRTQFDFIQFRRWTYIISALIIVPGLILIAVLGFNYSIEFTGGTLVQLEFRQPVQAADIRSALSEGGVGRAEIQSFGSQREYVIRAQERSQVELQAAGAESVANQIRAALDRRFGNESYEIARSEAVGPKVGGELRQKALIAMLLSFLVTLIYLAWRFEWRFGIAAVAATAHDFVAALAFIRFMNLEVSLVVVAALLTVIGYSLNDTIVVFDRIRENLRQRRKEPLYDTINRAVNETLPRTVLTGVTTIGTLLALLIFGGGVIRPFAWVLLFGVIVGTFSSIYVAAPVLLAIEHKWPRELGDRGGIVPRTAVNADRSRARPVEKAGSR